MNNRYVWKEKEVLFVKDPEFIQSGYSDFVELDAFKVGNSGVIKIDDLDIIAKQIRKNVASELMFKINLLKKEYFSDYVLQRVINDLEKMKQ